MDAFVNLFFEIDKNRTEVITVNELTHYVEEHGLDEEMITKWKNLFDSEDTGKITLEKFCQVLGIKLDTVRIQMEEMEQEQSKLALDYKIIARDISDDHKEEVIQKLRAVANSTVDFDKQAGEMKAYLDKRFGKSWTIIITPESFWMSISTIAGASIHIDMNETRYLIWKTVDV